MNVEPWIHRIERLRPLVVAAAASPDRRHARPVQSLAVVVGRLTRLAAAQVRAGGPQPPLDVVPSALAALLGVEALLPVGAAAVDRLEVLAAEALQLALGEPPPPLPEDPAERLEELLDGGTLDAGDRARVLLEADDLLSAAWTAQLLGVPPAPGLHGAAFRLRQRLWRACGGVVRVRLVSFVEGEAADRSLLADPVGPLLWAPPDAPLAWVLPPTEPVVVPVAEASGPGAADAPPAAATLEALTTVELAARAERDEPKLDGPPRHLFPPGGPVDGLPVVSAVRLSAVPSLLVLGADVLSAVQDGESLPARHTPFGAAVAHPWSGLRNAGPVSLVLAAGARRWRLGIAQPR